MSSNHTWDPSLIKERCQTDGVHLSTRHQRNSKEPWNPKRFHLPKHNGFWKILLLYFELVICMNLPGAAQCAFRECKALTRLTMWVTYRGLGEGLLPRASTNFTVAASKANYPRVSALKLGETHWSGPSPEFKWWKVCISGVGIRKELRISQGFKLVLSLNILGYHQGWCFFWNPFRELFGLRIGHLKPFHFFF